MSEEIKTKPHYFELSLRSVSNGELNQECPIVREYAKTSGELTMKQMMFTKETAADLVAVVVKAMDKMSMPFQEIGVSELAAQMEAMSGGQDQGQIPSTDPSQGQGQGRRVER